MKEEFECLICRDLGRTGGCPSCGKEKPLIENEKVKSINLSKLSNLGISKHFHESRWNQSILFNDRSDYYGNEKFIDYCNKLTDCYNILKDGKMIRMSALVSAPPAFGKTTWANSCILEAYENGFKVAPIIDTSQLRRMITINSEKPKAPNNYMGYTYSDYIESDLMFLLVTRGPEYVFAYETICNVLDLRSRMSKPTIILSDRSIRELCIYDKNLYLKTLLHGGTNVDPFRYAISIEMFNYLNQMPGELS